MDSSGSGGSAVNNPPPRKRHQSHTQKDVEDTDIVVQSLPPRKRLKSYTSKDDENEVVVQFMPPRKHHQSSTCTTAKDDDSNTIAIQSISKEKNDDDDDDAASKTITTWKKLHEITLLKGILEYYKENGTYPFDNTNGMQKFYEDWIEKGGVYVDEDAFSNKMVELPERFFMNQERVYRRKMIEGWKDPLEGNIFDLSHMIWGRDNDDDEGGPSAS